MTYSSKDKLYTMFGITQITKWSDIDGERQDSPLIDTRIEEALIDADDYINERLADNGYTVPFVAVPRRIVSLATLYAGIYLYDNKLKGGAENSVRDEVSRPRRRFSTVLRQILNGQLKLIHPLSGEVITKDSSLAPSVPDTVLNSVNDCCPCNLCGYNICICVPDTSVWEGL